MFTASLALSGDVIRTVRALAPLSLVAVLALSACGSSAASTASLTDAVSPSGREAIAVATSTDVYGAIVSRIGGDRVKVTSFIDNPNKDPLEYQATPADALAVSTANLVVANGGGYDDFMTKLVDAAGGERTVLDVATFSGLEDKVPAGGELNEHFWFNLTLMQDVGDEIAKDLGTASPADSATFTSNAKAFREDVDGLIAVENDIAKAYAGDKVAATEPLPLYLLEASKLVNATPEEFMAASESGEDPPAAVVQKTLDLVKGPDKIKALLLNIQTETPASDRLKAAANENGVPEVLVRETLAEPGEGYVAWIRGQLTALQTALETAG